MKKYLFTIILLIFISCSKGYEQEYKSYEEFSKINQRNKGWFPKIIFPDSKNLKNCSYLDSHTVFGSFNYSNSKKYDSVFSSCEKIEPKTLKEKLKNVEKLRPSWFLETENLSFENLDLVKLENFYLVKDKNNKRIIYWKFKD